MSNLTNQQIEALDLSKHTIVTANAGSGKTLILTKRFIETIRQKKIKYNQIVAITFTEKAAAELLAKISNEIDNLISQSSKNFSQSDIESIKEFRKHILSAKISTIHSFCYDLLTEFPIEAEIDPSTEIIDELYKKELIERSIEDALIEKIHIDYVRDILRLFGKDTTINLLQTLINKRYFTDLLIKKIYIGDPENFYDFDRYFNYINNTAIKYFNDVYLHKIKTARELISQIKSEVTLKKDKEKVISQLNELEKLFDEFIANLNFDLLSKIYDIIKEAILTKDKLTIRKRVFNEYSESSAIFKFWKIISEFKDFSNNINWDKKFEEEKYKLTLALIDLYQSSLNKFQQFKQLEGVLDFDDLLIITEKLLDNEQVKKELSSRFLFILVDEFQDTDSIQFNIIKKVADNFSGDNIVFVVGDEKQSIYGFRNAQLNIFYDFKYFLKERNNKFNDSKIVTLSTSFRSSPSIASFVNLVFSKLWNPDIFDSRQINYHQDVEYSPLQIGREKFTDEPVVFLLSSPEQNQSEKIADYILSLINSDLKIYDRNEDKFRKINFGDFALLFRTRAEIKDFENAFIKKNIPFVVSGGRGFYQSEEIRDWINYLNFLSNPVNDDSLLSILRSPFYALSDNEILEISFTNGNSFFEKLKNCASQKSNENLIKQSYQKLELHIKVASRYTIPELIQKILNDTFYYGNIDYHPKKSQIIANIEKLINVAHQFESRGLEDLKTFSNYIKNAFEKEESPEAVLSEIKGSVQMMTMHQAKGLEFPIVILPNFEKELRNSSIRFGEITINDYFGFCFKLTDDEGNNIHTISSFFGNNINQKIDYNEQLRLLYVALTRATEKLIIAFEHDEQNSGKEKYCFKQILLSSLQPINLSSNNIFEIDTKLTFIKKLNDQFVEFENDYKLKFEIIKEFSPRDIKLSNEEKEYVSDKSELKIFTHPLTEKIKEEIFTATQFNVYEFCPFKYLLKFVIGYNPYKNYYSEFDEDDFIKGAEFGSVFHALMEKLNSPDLKDACKILDEILEYYPKSIKSKLKEEIISKFTELLNNKNFLEIFSAQKSFREFKIRIKFQNQILFGIIDRVNLNQNKITIIDYKTDSFPIEKYDEKVREYKTQMEFYAMIVSEFFRTKEIELNLFFINYPDKPFKFHFTEEQIKTIRKKFESIISQIVLNKFPKNTQNCTMCEYSKSSKCIVI